jgi:prepilin-type N-terminal cleavage/methylation domain-containing protein
MKPSTLLRFTQNFLSQKLSRNHQSNSGFSLIELLVVVLMIGIFSAIAAPSWNAFTTRQRIKSVNTQLLQAIKTTQAEAKRNKSDYVLEFNTGDDPPTYNIYKYVKPPELPDKQQPQSLSLDGAIKENMLKIYSQVQGTEMDKIPFNFNGGLDEDKLKEDKIEIKDTGKNTDGFSVVVYPKDSPNSRNCIIVQTILGATRTAQGTDPKTGCPTPP